MENIIWRKKVQAIIAAFVAYTIAVVADPVLETIGMLTGGDLLDIVGKVYDALTGEALLVYGEWYEVLRVYETLTGESSLDFFDLAEYLVQFVIIAGYFMLLGSLKEFSRIQTNEEDRASVMEVRKSYIFLLVAAIADFIPIIGGVLWLIFYIIAYAKLIGGFKRLSKSEQIPQIASDGFRGLKSCVIWILVGGIISIIPVVGDALNGLINIVVFFVMLHNWKKVRNNGPEVNEANLLITQNEEESAEAETKRLRTTYLWLSVYFVISFLLTCIDRILIHPLLSEFIANEAYDSYGLYSMIVFLVKKLIYLGMYLCLFSITSNSNGKFRLGCVLLICRSLLTILFEILISTGQFDYEVSEFYYANGQYLNWCVYLPLYVLGFIFMGLGLKANNAVKAMLFIYPMYSVLYYIIEIPFGVEAIVDIIYAVAIPLALFKGEKILALFKK